MNDPFRTLEDYELFLYTLAENYPAVRNSNVTLIRQGSTLARVTGELQFDNDIRLVIRERVVYQRLPIAIDQLAAAKIGHDKSVSCAPAWQEISTRFIPNIDFWEKISIFDFAKHSRVAQPAERVAVNH